jgi:hypothetical protein
MVRRYPPAGKAEVVAQNARVSAASAETSQSMRIGRGLQLDALEATQLLRAEASVWSGSSEVCDPLSMIGLSG